ncbi:MAG: ABC transporter permease, partial [Bifidobacteriaceae bacterium]|nr:ABC transporter permease [Bifidobacteriaceae bacterium]
MRLLARRLALSVVVFFGLVATAFVLVQILPGDPARAAAGRLASAEQVEAMRVKMGLDQSIPQQFVAYLGRVLRGDLGNSVFTHRAVLDDIGEVLPSSLELALAAMVLNICIGVPLGVIAAYRRGSPADLATRLVAITGATLPVFWLGLLLQFLFASKLGWLPLFGHLSFGEDVPTRTGMVTFDALLAGDIGLFWSALVHIALPAVTLATPFIAVIARTVRSSMITALDSDYVMLARSTGASEPRVVIRHALRNALIPAVTILGMQLGWMLGATVLVESTFSRTGIGAYMVS